ncbi:MAG TPA: hypothetical protein VHY08_25200 [Bacillota bacterium]|nr:hypothetical protein [Bacillota bacterium]
MDESEKIGAIVSFVSRHPQSTASRRICREIIGRGTERFNEEFASELTTGLKEKDETSIDSYYSLIR